MAKDTYYFKHDSNAKDDPKCMLLIDQLGLEGYGIYWVLVEMLRDQPEYKYPMKLLPVLAKRYLTSAEKFMTVVKNYALFEIENDEFFFSKSLIDRMQPLEVNREKRRIAGIRSGEVRRLKSELRNNEQKTNTCSTDVEQNPNKNEQRREEERREEKSKEDGSNTPPPTNGIDENNPSLEESENGAYMSFQSIQDRMLSDAFIKNVATSKRWEERRFKRHVFDWLHVKQLSGTYRDFTLGKLKEFCIRDYKPTTQEQPLIYQPPANAIYI